MIELDNETTLQVNKLFLEKVSSTMTQKNIELIITSNQNIQTINFEHRGINAPTDVLSFPYEDMPMAPLGTIIISSSYVLQKAKELKHSNHDELSLLFIHGLLHILGYDHEVDDGEMRIKEKELIEKFALPKSLIVRTEG